MNTGNIVARNLLTDVLDASKVIMTCPKSIIYSKSSPEYADFKWVLGSLNAKFWDLLGLLQESKAFALNLVTEEDCPFASLRNEFINFGSKLDLASQGHPVDSDNPPFEPLPDLSRLRAELTKYVGRARVICTTLDQLIDLFASRTSGILLAHCEDALTTMFSRLRDVGHDLHQGRIATLGNKLEPIFNHFGRAWVLRRVGQGRSDMSKLQEIQLDVLQGLSKLLEEKEMFHLLSSSPALKDLQESISKEVKRTNSQRFCVALCGMTKAGKSFFLNTLIGLQLLPSDVLPATAWPVRVQHDRDAHVPKLFVNAECFEKSLNELRAKKIASNMVSYTRPDMSAMQSQWTENDSIDDLSSTESDNDPLLEPSHSDPNDACYHVWKDLHEVTKANLAAFEQPSFRLPESVAGEVEVVRLLGMVNDIIRLCRLFAVQIPEAAPDTWPRLLVGFESLRDNPLEFTFEFVDLPGLGEGHSDYYSFENLVRIAAREADAIIPIVSFKEVSNDDWRNILPQIVLAGLMRPPDFVLCTHMDQVLECSVTDLVRSVGKAFWPKTLPNLERRVLRCSSRLGFGASKLLTLSRNTKPEFQSIWEEDTIMYDCVESILGSSEEFGPKFYDSMMHDEWIKAIEKKLHESRLSDTMAQITTGVMDSAKGRALQFEGGKIMSMSRKIASEKRRQLVEISRSVEEFQLAYGRFQKSLANIKGILVSCEKKGGQLTSDAEDKLTQAYTVLERRGRESAIFAIDSLRAKSNNTRGTRVLKTSAKANEVIFVNKYEAQDFIYTVHENMVQSVKNTLTRDFVNFVRELADQTRQRLFKHLEQALESAMKDQLAPPELVQDIMDKIGFDSQDAEELFFASLKGKVVRTDVERHNVATAYTAIKKVMKKPFIPSSGSGDGDPLDSETDILNRHYPPTPSTSDFFEGRDGRDDTEESEPELGLLIRVSIDVLATLPLIFGAFVWPWVIHERKLVVDVDLLATQLHEQVQKPFFRAIKKEADKTIKSIVMRSSRLAQKAVQDSLREEEARFERERLSKKLHTPDTTSLPFDIVSLFLCFSAATSGLEELQLSFKNVLQNL